MTTPIPMDLFANELLPSESIEWTGQPNTRVVFHQEDLYFIPFSLMWGGFAIFWMIAASGLLHMGIKHQADGFQYFGIIWGTPFVVIGQYFIWGRFLYARWKKRRTYYALTNRRALIVQQGFKGRSTTSAFFENITVIDKRVRSDGNGIISFGGPVMGEVKFGRTNTPRPPTFDDIDDADAVFQSALRLQERARKTSIAF